MQLEAAKKILKEEVHKLYVYRSIFAINHGRMERRSM